MEVDFQETEARENAKKGCIVELLQKAVECRRQLDVGEVADQQAIPRGEGISRARGTQIMGCCG